MSLCVALGNDLLKEMSVRKPNVLFDTDVALSSCIISLSRFPLLEKGHFSSHQAVFSQHLAIGKKKWTGVFDRNKSENGGEKQMGFLRCP